MGTTMPCTTVSASHPPKIRKLRQARQVYWLMLHPTLKPSRTENSASHLSVQWRFHFVRIDSCGDSSGFPPDSLLSLFGTLLRVYETIRIWTIFILKQGLTFDNYEFMVADGRLSAALSPDGSASFTMFHAEYSTRSSYSMPAIYLGTSRTTNRGCVNRNELRQLYFEKNKERCPFSGARPFLVQNLSHHC